MPTDRYTKTILTLIAACLLALTLHTLLEPNQTTHAAASNVQFSADKDHLYFYDPSTQKIYTYLVVGGHTQNILQFTEVGNELKSTPLH